MFSRILLLLAFVFSAASAAEKPMLLVTGENAYPPLTGPQLPKGGLMTEVVQRVLSEMGLASNVQYVHWNRAYQMTLTGQAFATFPYVKDQQRLEHFNFSAPLHVFTERFFVRADSTLQFNTVDDLADKTMCRPSGYSLRNLEELLASRKIWLWRSESLDECFMRLKESELDLVPVPVDVGWETVKSLYGHSKGFKTLEKPLGFNGQYLMVSKQWPGGLQILEAFNTALAKLRQQGVIATIYDRHKVIEPDEEALRRAR